MRFVLLLLLASMLCPLTVQADEVFHAFAGANGIWFDNDSSPADIELGGTARASLSPHISLVGSLFYGFDNSYLRGSGGVRLTATDVNNHDFSIGIGIQRHVSSEPTVRSEEWAPDVSIGWKPWPVTNPKVIVVAQGGYGLDTDQAHALVGVRYQVGGGQ